jgi:hypothetical protein
VAVADVDGDGDLDFATANQWEDSYFFRNDCPNPGNFLILNCVISGSGDKVKISKGHIKQQPNTYPAIGSQISVYLPSGVKLTSQIDGGNGHSGKRSPHIHFGLNDLVQEKIKTEIYWRDNIGATHKKQIELEPGWNTLILGGE